MGGVISAIALPYFLFVCGVRSIFFLNRKERKEREGKRVRSHFPSFCLFVVCDRSFFEPRRHDSAAKRDSVLGHEEKRKAMIYTVSLLRMLFGIISSAIENLSLDNSNLKYNDISSSNYLHIHPAENGSLGIFFVVAL
ncbi:hypothetical protein ACE1CI_35185 [Aerosakkonemataceae cyanobacterium BLCC-F50]|uniref:Uncharacterized protein n=1 Tax=Floridaenema flaviceps BLCC-F50 TaxID=3153642 RepID=A0ABV4Y2Q4_9CYAN